MRLETFPLVLGLALGVIAVALLLDAWMPEHVSSERRRRSRHGRDRVGEALVGLGTLAMAATFVGRDTWRYSVLAAIAGVILLVWGTKRNRDYLRGALRRDGQPIYSKYQILEGSRRIR